MDRHDVQNGIHTSWGFVDKVGIAESFSNPSLFEADEKWIRLSLDPSATYADLYNEGLTKSLYNFILDDYSYFQFSWLGRDNVRYAFYPNPYIANTDDLATFKRRQRLLSEETITMEDYLELIRSSSAHGRIPMFRYENAPGQWKELRHPCSHLHIGFHVENRWPICRVLTPRAFTMLIVKQYYPTQWAFFGQDDNAVAECKFEQELIDEKQICRLIGDSHFSDVERRSFHIG